MSFSRLTPEADVMVGNCTAVLNLLFFAFLILLVPLGQGGWFDIGVELRHYTALVLWGVAAVFLLFAVIYYSITRVE